MASLEDLLGDDLAEVPMIPLVLHLVGGQRVISSLNRDVLVGDPDAGGFPGQATLAVEAPVTVADIPLLIDPAAGQQRSEDAGQLLIADRPPLDVVEDLGRAAPIILPLEVSPMLLAVVVVDPGRVPFLKLAPGGRLARCDRAGRWGSTRLLCLWGHVP